LVGFLEFGGRYGHMGAWPYQLYITEFCPYSNDESENQKKHDLYAQYMVDLKQDKKDIQATIDQWISAIKSADVDALKITYSPDSPFYMSLMETSGQVYVKQNKMDITINNMDIFIQGRSATVNVLDAVVNPPRYFTPTGNVQVVGDGLYKLRSIALVKISGEWKIVEYHYSPDYQIPSTSIN
jgi:hypothetical protein